MRLRHARLTCDPVVAGLRTLRQPLTCAALSALLLATGATPSTAQVGADFLAANIDSTVAPGDDFFQYAIGAWLKRNPIPDGASRWGLAQVVLADIELELRRINEDAAARQAPQGSLEQLIGDFWATGMDSVTINAQGLTPLQPDLQQIDRIRSIPDLMDVIAVHHRRDQSIFVPPHRVVFLGRVEQDEANTERRMFSLVQSGITMPSPDAYTATDAAAVRRREAFRESLLRTFLRLHGDSARASRSAEAVFDLETRLAAGFDREAGYRKIGLADLGRVAPTIDWPRYMQQIGAGGVDSVSLRSPRFYQTLDTLLRTTSLDTWKDYLRFWLIKVNSPRLDDSTFRIFWDYDNALRGAPAPRPRWQRVMAQLRNQWLGQPLAVLFEREFFPAGVRARHRAVGESMRDAFRRRVERADWLSDATRQLAVRKLARLRITLGLPERLNDYSTMPLRRDSYVLNGIRASTWYRDREISSLSRPVDRDAGEPRPEFSDAWYDGDNNEVRIGPVSILLGPGLPDEELDDAVVFGASWIGHEIAHALDSAERYRDAYGNRVDSWTSADEAAFTARARVLIEQYDEFMPIEGMHVNGQRSLPENMADLVGLRIALDAFKQTEQFRRGEAIGGFTPLQRFFLAYAFGRAQAHRPESLAAMLRSGAYAPGRERVNGVVVNIPEFYEAFSVKPGDRMYRPESARAAIW